MGDTPIGLTIPKLTPGWRAWAKDLIIVGTALAGVYSWASSKADNWVQSAAYQRDKNDRAERDKVIDERIKALETRASTIETATTETKTDVKVMRVEQAASQKTLDRIETILGERKR